jgi:hypothetical protein
VDDRCVVHGKDVDLPQPPGFFESRGNRKKAFFLRTLPGGDSSILCLALIRDAVMTAMKTASPTGIGEAAWEKRVG